MFHLHANIRDGTAFEDIQLYIIDTTRLPRGVFLRDLDLIRAYSSFASIWLERGSSGHRNKADVFILENIYRKVH
jgi:hypothetical protein